MRAIVIGATGLVGAELVKLLLADSRCTALRTFVRRPSGIVHAKLEEQVVDFDNPLRWRALVAGDVLFSTLGTTLKRAGSQAAQWKVDYTYQMETARSAAANAVPCYVLVSSGQARPDSRMFYLRMKGELERDVAALPFRHTVILKPGMLRGERAADPRPGERVLGIALETLSALPGLARLKPISGRDVAHAMWNAALAGGSGLAVSEGRAVHELGSTIQKI